MKLLIFTNGGENIGFGHIMRCLSIANTANEMGHSVMFASCLEAGIDTIINTGFKCLKIDFASKSHLRDTLVHIIKENSIDAILTDSYDVDRAYMDRLNKLNVLTIYLDDNNRIDYDGDVLVNGNIGAEKFNYNKNNTKQFLLGTEYNLIRDEFKDIEPISIKEQCKAIFITSGGADFYHQCFRIGFALKSNPRTSHLKQHIVIGNAFSNTTKTKLIELEQKYEGIYIYKSPDKISEIMKKCDIAISSAGSTLYELCACGLPTLSYIIADNQIKISEYMDNAHIIESLGWYNNYKNDDLCNKIINISDNYNDRIKISEIMKNIVDGKGTERVIKAIEAMGI